ncbi:MAG: CerR family C-terminal domain-containing protein [Planctomycetaceae bacterium]
MADETRVRMLEAAGPIFAEKGFDATTVREICAAAEVNVASVNYHFGSKETLYLQTVKLAYRQRLQRVPPAAWPADAQPAHKLQIFVSTILNRVLGEGNIGWETRLLMREMLQPTQACQPVMEEYIRPQWDQLMGILDELLPDETTHHVRHQVAFSIVGQCLHYRFANEFVLFLIGDDWQNEAYSVGRLAQHITRFSLAAINGLSEVDLESELETQDVKPPIPAMT